MHYIYGIHAVTALLQVHPSTVQCIYRLKKSDRLDQIVALAKQQEIRVAYELPFQTTKAHQGVIAQCDQLPLYHEHDLFSLLDHLLERKESPLLLILDHLQDPHNLGACLRTADAVGVDAVILPKKQAVGLTPAVRKVACGAAETTPVVCVTNLVRTIKALQEKGVWVYGATAQAPGSLYSLALTGSVALILGAEGQGLRQLTAKQCDQLFSIPMFGTVESLNVSVATGIALFEAVRQRRITHE